MTSGDLTFDQKSHRSDFFLIFDALSNAACPVSLRGPGAELERGGVQTHTPPAGRGNPGPPAGRGLKLIFICKFYCIFILLHSDQFKPKSYLKLI